MAVALGFCAAFGTLIPPLFNGEFASKVLGTNSGMVILLGVGVCLTGIAVSGMAGMTTENEMSEVQKRAVIKEFNFKKGILVAIPLRGREWPYAGLTAGEPIKSPHRPAWKLAPLGGLPVLAGDFARRFYHQFHLVCLSQYRQSHRRPVSCAAGGRVFRRNIRQVGNGNRSSGRGDGSPGATGVGFSKIVAGSAGRELSLLRAGWRDVVPPIFLLHHGRKPDGPVPSSRVDAAHGEHYHCAPWGLALNMERRVAVP